MMVEENEQSLKLSEVGRKMSEEVQRIISEAFRSMAVPDVKVTIEPFQSLGFYLCTVRVKDADYTFTISLRETLHDVGEQARLMASAFAPVYGVSELSGSDE